MLGFFASALSASVSPTVTYQGSAADTADLTTYTFASQPIGTASASRRVVVAIHTRTATISTVTIGGVSATLDRDYNLSNNRVTIASAVVPTGTTASVVVTFTAAGTRCGIGVWSLSSGSPTGQTATGSGTTTAACTVTTVAGQVVIAATTENGTVGTTVAWTGATERYDQTLETDLGQSGADTVAAGTSTAISAAFSSTTGSIIAAVAYA